MNNKRQKVLKPTHVYVGRDDGGCVLALCSDYRNEETGRFVAEMISGGLIVSRVDWETYTNVVSQEENFMKCGCTPEPELQPTLFQV